MRNLWARYRSDLIVLLLLLILCGLFFWRIITPRDEDRGYFPSGESALIRRRPSAKTELDLGGKYLGR